MAVMVPESSSGVVICGVDATPDRRGVVIEARRDGSRSA